MSGEVRRRARQTVRHLHWLVMIALPPTNKKPARDFREELIVEVMESNGLSREEAELAIDSSY